MDLEKRIEELRSTLDIVLFLEPDRYSQVREDLDLVDDLLHLVEGVLSEEHRFVQPNLSTRLRAAIKRHR